MNGATPHGQGTAGESVSSPAAFLHAMFNEDDWIELRCIEEHKGGNSRNLSISRADLIEKLPEICATCEAEGRAVFFGVLPRIRGRTGTNDSVLEGHVVWVDVDYKTSSEAAVVDRVGTFCPQPNIIVSSGHGLHLYWLLQERASPDLLRECADRASYALRADRCHDPARILRLPSSVNVKTRWSVSTGVDGEWSYSPAGEAPRCEMIGIDTETRHSVMAFLSLPDPPAVVGQAAHNAAFERQAPVPGEEIPAVVWDWLLGEDADPHLADLYAGSGRTEGDLSNSGYDAAYAAKLVRLGVVDPDVLDAAINTRTRTDDRKRTEREVRRAVDYALHTVVPEERGIDDHRWAKSSKIFSYAYEKRYAPEGPPAGDVTEEEADSGHGTESAPKTPEHLAYEEAENSLRRIERVVAEQEAHLPELQQKVARTNDVRQRLAAARQNEKRIAAKARDSNPARLPLNATQLLESPAVRAAMGRLKDIQELLRDAELATSEMALTLCTSADVAERKIRLDECRDAVAEAKQWIAAAKQDAQAEALRPELDAARAEIVALEKELAETNEARATIADIKTGPALIKKARKAKDVAEKAFRVSQSGFIPDPNVVNRLALDDFGRVERNKYNLQLILKEEPYFKDAFSYDTFSDRPLYKGAALDDDVETRLAILIEGAYRARSVAVTDLHAVARVVAKEHAFHGVQRYLNGLTWDGVSRIDQVLARGFGALKPEGDPSLLPLMSRKFLLSLVARAFEPGCKMDTMLILSGKTGKFKSMGLRALVSPDCVPKDAPWFSDTAIRLGDKSAIEQVQGVWLFEIAELSTFAGAWAAIKNALSSSTDNIRLAYGRNKSMLPRQGGFCGTTNDEEFLDDPTSNRRFPSCQVSHIDVAWLQENREQIWAEAVSIYRKESGTERDQSRWWYNAAEQDRLNKHNTQFKTPDPWLFVVQSLIEKRRKQPAWEGQAFSMQDIYNDLGILVDKQDRKSSRRISSVLTELECVKLGPTRLPGKESVRLYLPNGCSKT